MREIKFRSWCESGRYWNVTWQDLARASDEGKIIWEMFLNPDWIIEQYTGQKDKNGREIYEGDIIKRITKIEIWQFTGKVFFQTDGGIGWSVKARDGRHGLNSNDDYEVIGNIHENGDLLK
jgi:uncharacterized phage protein (TIGR01671 family)